MSAERFPELHRVASRITLHCEPRYIEALHPEAAARVFAYRDCWFELLEIMAEVARELPGLPQPDVREDTEVSSFAPRYAELRWERGDHRLLLRAYHTGRVRVMSSHTLFHYVFTIAPDAANPAEPPCDVRQLVELLTPFA